MVMERGTHGVLSGVTSRADVDSSFILSVAIGQLRASELLLRHSPISSTVAPLRGDTKGKMGVASAGVTLRSTISTSTALAYRRDAVDRHNWEAARNAITTGVGRRVPDGNIGHSAWAAMRRTCQAEPRDCGRSLSSLRAAPRKLGRTPVLLNLFGDALR